MSKQPTLFQKKPAIFESGRYFLIVDHFITSNRIISVTHFGSIKIENTKSPSKTFGPSQRPSCIFKPNQTKPASESATLGVEVFLENI